jgi:methyltransferase (TIGR00027 family)
VSQIKNGEGCAGMPGKRIEATTSRTAEWTCMSRAASSLEEDSHYRSDDDIAALLVPSFVRVLLHLSPIRVLFRRVAAPKGIYEYVIARTKYIDAAFKQALADRFDQIVLLGAGFDTRALRFQSDLGEIKVYELDSPLTQRAKIDRLRQRGLFVPPNVAFVGIDFERESLTRKLNEIGLRDNERSLFILEGVLMYLQPESADATMRTIRAFAGKGSRLVFDYARSSVLRGENTTYGERGVTRSVARVNEEWRFGIEPSQLESFLSTYGFRLKDHEDSSNLEKLYFQDSAGQVVGRVNGTQCLVTAEKL